MFDESRARKYTGIFDQRVQDLKLSLGEAFMREIGLVEDPMYTPPHAAETYEDLRLESKKYYGTSDITKDQRKEYAKKESDVLNRILANAAVVVCINFVAGS